MNYYGGSTGRSVFKSSAISTRPLQHGCDGNTNGFDVESERRCIGWAASRGEIQSCSSCGNSAFDRRLDRRSRMRRESSRPVL